MSGCESYPFVLRCTLIFVSLASKCLHSGIEFSSIIFIVGGVISWPH